MTITLKINAPHMRNRDNVRREKPLQLGNKAKHDMLHNCLTCFKWSACKDDQKSAHYRCTKYRESTIEETDLSTLMESGLDWTKKKNNSAEDDLNALFDAANPEESITQMIEKVLSENIPVPPDLRINDSHIPTARNLQEWILGKKFSGGKQMPFPRQIEVGTKLFAEFCPRCSDMDWFEDMPVDAPLTEIQDRVVFLEHGICPECDVRRNTLIAKKEMHDYFSCVLLCGQRSTKTSSSILWESYNTHRALKMSNPSGVYGLLEGQPITSTYTALTFGQAVTNVWTFFKQILDDYPWYKQYHEFLDARGQELGEELYKVSDHFARYRHRNLFLAPSSPSKRIMRGSTRISAIVDELGWFPLARKGDRKGNSADFERLDAKGVMTALENSMLTIRKAYNRRLKEGFHVPKPMFITASSPQAYNDAIMTIYRETVGSRFTLSLKYPTWEFNPNLPRDTFDPEFEKDPVGSARDFGCEPPIGEGLFLNDTEALSKCFIPKRMNPIQTQTFKGFSKTKKKITTSSVKFVGAIEPDYPTIMCVDIGLVHNSLAFSVIGLPNDYDDELDGEDRGTMLNPIQIFAVGEVIPRDDTRISLTHWYTHVLLPLVDRYNVAYFVSDRWQNAKIMSDLEQEQDVNPIEWKCTWEDFENLRELLYSGNATFPKLDTNVEDVLQTTLDDYPELFRKTPMDHLFYQFATVKESTGATVLKGDGTTDDLFRTITLGAALMQDEEVFEYIVTNRMGYSGGPRQGPNGIVYKMSSGVGSSGGALSQGDRGIGVVVKHR